MVSCSSARFTDRVSQYPENDPAPFWYGIGPRSETVSEAFISVFSWRSGLPTVCLLEQHCEGAVTAFCVCDKLHVVMLLVRMIIHMGHSKSTYPFDKSIGTNTCCSGERSCCTGYILSPSDALWRTTKPGSLQNYRRNSLATQ